MAVENKYVNADIVANKKVNVNANAGALTWTMEGSFEVAVADSDLSVYRIIKGAPWNLIPSKIEIYNDVITDGTDYDLGIYESTVDGVEGPVIDREALAAALDMTSAGTRPTPKDGMNAVDIGSPGQTLLELAGETLTDHKTNYDIAFTAVTVGSALGTVAYRITFIQG